MKDYPKNKKIMLLVLVTFLVLYPLLVGQSHYFMTLLVMCCIFSVATMALNLLIGYGGQISVGHAAFLTVGGYSVAVLADKFNMPMILALPLSGVITALVGMFIGIPAVRLSGHFLAVATLGFALSIPQIAINWDSVTGGYNGIAVQVPSILSSQLSLYYVVVFVVWILTWLLYCLLNSRIGRAFIAIRESEVAAQAIGVNVAFYKTMMFVISAFFTGISGGLYAYWVGFVSPSDFSMMTSFLLLAMVVVGGLASIPGSIIGATLFTIIPHFTDEYIGITNIVIGVAIVLILFIRPAGIISFFFQNKKGLDINEDKMISDQEMRNQDVKIS